MFKNLFKSAKPASPVLRIETTGERVSFRLSDGGDAEAWLTSPPEALSALDRQRCRILMQWVMDGLAEVHGEQLEVSAPTLYLADREDVRAFDLAPPCRVKFALSAKGSLHEPTFALALRMTQPDGSPLVGFERQACFLQDESTRWLLSGLQYEWLCQLEAFRARPETERNYEAQLAAFSRIKASVAELNVMLDQYLLKETATIAAHVGIELVETGPDEIEVRPVVAGVEPMALARAVDLQRAIPAVMTVPQPDGARQRVVVEPEVQTGLAQIKRVRRLRGKDRREFLARPQDFLDATVVHLEDFSERVKGIGQFPIRYYPLIQRSERSWIPERIGMVIESDDPSVGVVELDFETLAEFEPLQQAYQKAAAEGEPVIPFGPHRLPIDGDTEITLGAIREALQLRQGAEAEPQSEAPEGDEPVTGPEPEDDRAFLIIHSNEDDDEYAETAPLKGETLAMVRPRALKSSVKLLKHQAEGIAWLQSRFKSGQRGVILADDMGLGKTVQLLTFLAWYAQEVAEPRPILVVAPVALLENWRDEYYKFLEPVFGEPLALHGGRLAAFRIGASGREYQDGGRKLLDTQTIAQHRLVLTTYEAVRDYQFSLASIHWGIVVTDEAQKIKTPGALMTNAAKALKTDFRVAATGTPVENSLVDLWCLTDFAQPGLLGALKTFRARYDQPKDRAQDDGEANAQALREELGANFLRRLKVDILQDLPPRNEHEVVIPMSVGQARAYLEATETYRRGAKGRGSVLAVLRQLRDLCVHPAMGGEEEIEVDLKALAGEAPKHYWAIEKLKEISAKGEKAVLFTEDRRLQRVLAFMVQRAFGILPSIVNGTVPGSSGSGASRKDMIDAFQAKSGFNVIILSPVAVGFGLTITAANHVIHVTRLWNPAKEDQATDRCHRIGQDKPVEVYYPIAADPHRRFQTFDQILAALLSKKRQLARNVLFPTEDLVVEGDALVQMLLEAPSTSQR